jgi:hypothetical protein
MICLRSITALLQALGDPLEAVFAHLRVSRLQRLLELDVLPVHAYGLFLVWFILGERCPEKVLILQAVFAEQAVV